MKKNSHFLLMVLSLCSGNVTGDSIKPKDSQVLYEEGKKVTLSCSYSTTNTYMYYLYWYRHYPDTAPQYILHKANRGTIGNIAPFAEGRFTSEVTTNSTHLYISDLKTEDSATYLCALQGTGTYKLIFGKGTKLIVRPKTDRDLPSVYQLKSSKTVSGLPDSVCLVTDIPSVEQKLILNERNISSEVVLDKSDTDVWRTSVVIWDYDNPSGTLPCKLHYGNIEVSPDSDTDESQNTCSSLSIDESFRTNPSMNTLSLTVLGLRVLTIKAIVFNVIITLRLWSS